MKYNIQDIWYEMTEDPMLHYIPGNTSYDYHRQGETPLG